MSSTYVEVREAENGVGELGFQLNDCETNGIDIQSHYNAFPAKDHTYNKDPSFVDEDFFKKKAPEKKNNENELPKKIVRAHRNVKHKIIKPRDEENVIKPEIEDVKKSSSKDFFKKQTDSEAKNNENEIPKKIVRAHRNIKHKLIKPRNEENVIKSENEDSKKSPSESQLALCIKSSSYDPHRVIIVTIGVQDQDPVSEPLLVQEENKTTVENNESESNSEMITPKRSNRKKKTEESNEQEIVEKTVKSPKKRKSQVNSKKENENLGESSPEKEESPLKKSKPEVVKSNRITKIPEPKETKKQIEETPTKTVKDEEDIESQGLPPGWIRKIVERKSGKTAGLCDVYIYSPEGIKFRSRPDVAAYLLKTKSKFRIEDFSFKRPSFSTPSPSVEKKSPKLVAKKEKERISAGSSKKKAAKLKVKIATPRKSINKTPTKETSKLEDESQASNSESKRTGANRKKKNT